MSHDNLQRRIAMLETLPRHPRKLTASQLCQRLDDMGYQVTTRSVQRDLRAMFEMGLFGICLDQRSRPFGWSIEQSWKGLNLTLMDTHVAIALTTLRRYASQLLPQQSIKELRPYFQRAEQLLRNDRDNPWRHWVERVAILPPPYPYSLPEVDEEILQQLNQAMLEKRQVKCEIKRIIKGEVRWLRYEPVHLLGMAVQDGAMQAFFTLGSFQQRIYSESLLCFRNIQLLDAPALQPDSFDIQRDNRTLNGGKIGVVLKFEKNAGFILQGGRLSDDQTNAVLPDNRILVSATVKDTQAFRSLIWNMGSQVEVVEPRSLRRYIQRKLTKLNAMYKK